MKSSSSDLRDFYDASQAAEAAARWPLLQQVWRLLDGDRLTPSSTNATKLHVQPPPAPREPIVRDESRDGIVQPDESATADQPAPSLEDLFGRLR